MSHPIILACLLFRPGKWFSIADAKHHCELSHSSIRHRLEELTAVGILQRKVEYNHLKFMVKDAKRLEDIRVGREKMTSAKVLQSAPPMQDHTLPLASILGYAVKALPGVRHSYEREDYHNPDMSPRAGHQYSTSSLEIV